MIFDKIAKAGYAEAQYWLGHFYITGNYTDLDHQKGRELWEMAAKQGHCEALKGLGLLNIEYLKDYEKAVDCFQQAIDKGDAEAYFYLGLCYENGYGVDKDPVKAAELYEVAADKGEKNGQYALSKCYAAGIGVPKNLEKAVELCQLSADQENVEAQVSLGKFYAEGIVLPKNAEKAVEYFNLAAAQGNAEANFQLALCHVKGEGVSEDLIEALRLLDKAYKLGLEKAVPVILFLTCPQRGYDKKAFEENQKLAETGDEEAMWRLGFFYFLGLVVSEDIDKAAELWKKAAEKGQKYAQKTMDFFIE